MEQSQMKLIGLIIFNQSGSSFWLFCVWGRGVRVST